MFFSLRWRQHPAGGLSGLKLVDDLGLGPQAAAADDLEGRVSVARERLGRSIDRQTTGRPDSQKTFFLLLIIGITLKQVTCARTRTWFIDIHPTLILFLPHKKPALRSSIRFSLRRV